MQYNQECTWSNFELFSCLSPKLPCIYVELHLLQVSKANREKGFIHVKQQQQQQKTTRASKITTIKSNDNKKQWWQQQQPQQQHKQQQQ